MAEPLKLLSPHEAVGAPYRTGFSQELTKTTPNEKIGETTYLGDTGIALRPGCQAKISDVVCDQPGFKMEEVSCGLKNCHAGRIFASRGELVNTGPIRNMLGESCRKTVLEKRSQPPAPNTNSQQPSS